MKISASIKNELHKNELAVSTNGQSKNILIPSKESGYGSVCDTDRVEIHKTLRQGIHIELLP